MRLKITGRIERENREQPQAVRGSFLAGSTRLRVAEKRQREDRTAAMGESVWCCTYASGGWGSSSNSGNFEWEIKRGGAARVGNSRREESKMTRRLPIVCARSEYRRGSFSFQLPLCRLRDDSIANPLSPCFVLDPYGEFITDPFRPRNIRPSAEIRDRCSFRKQRVYTARSISREIPTRVKVAIHVQVCIGSLALYERATL